MSDSLTLILELHVLVNVYGVYKFLCLILVYCTMVARYETLKSVLEQGTNLNLLGSFLANGGATTNASRGKRVAGNLNDWPCMTSSLAWKEPIQNWVGLSMWLWSKERGTRRKLWSAIVGFLGKETDCYRFMAIPMVETMQGKEWDDTWLERDRNHTVDCHHQRPL